MLYHIKKSLLHGKKWLKFHLLFPMDSFVMFVSITGSGIWFLWGCTNANKQKFWRGNTGIVYSLFFLKKIYFYLFKKGALLPQKFSTPIKRFLQPFKAVCFKWIDPNTQRVCPWHICLNDSSFLTKLLCNGNNLTFVLKQVEFI